MEAHFIQRLIVAIFLAASTSWATADPIHDAVCKLDVAEVRRLLDKGADVNAREASTQKTLLIKAVEAAASEGKSVAFGAERGNAKALEQSKTNRAQNLKIIKLLLEKGADTGLKDSKNTTAIGIAIGQMDMEVLTILNPKQGPLHATDSRGRTILQRCVMEVARLNERLRSSAASATTAEKQTQRDDYQRLIETLLARGADINAKDDEGRTALWKAVDFHDVELAEWLMEKGADAKILDHNGMSLCSFTQRNMRQVLVKHSGTQREKEHIRFSRLIQKLKEKGAVEREGNFPKIFLSSCVRGDGVFQMFLHRDSMEQDGLNFHEEEGFISSVSALPGGKHAVVGGWDKTVRLWDLNLAKCLRVMNGHGDRVTSVSALPDGRRALSASRDGTVRLWDMPSGKCLRVMAGHTGEVTGVAVAGRGKLAVSASHDQTLRVWDMESGECLRELTGHTDKVLELYALPDGRRVLSRGYDNAIRLWDVETGECLRTLPGFDGDTRWCALPDGEQLATCDAGGTLRLWEAGTGRCLRTLKLQGDSTSAGNRIFSIHARPDSNSLLIAEGSKDLNRMDAYDQISSVNLETGVVKLLLRMEDVSSYGGTGLFLFSGTGASSAPDVDFDAISPENTAATSVSETRGPDPLPRKDWTVMFFMNARNELSSPAWDDIHEMMQDGSGERLNFVVQEGEIGTATMRYWIGKKRLFTEEILPECDFGDCKQLADFISWSKKRYPAKNYMLVIWGHGGNLQGISFDYQHDSHFKVTDFKKLFAQAGSVDFLLFNSCRMQSAEVIYELRGGANYVLGSELEMPVDSMNYSVMGRILSAPGLTLREKARKIVLSAPQDYRDTKKPFTFSAVDTSVAAKLPRYLDPVARQLKGGVIPLKAAFGDQFRLDNGKSSTIDLAGMADHLSQTASSSNARALRDFVRNELVIAHVAKNCGGFQPGGITIELPYPNQYQAADFFKTTYPMIGLSKTAKWHELIQWISTLK